MNTSRVQHLAYRLWQHRGMPMGSPDEDWFLAERLIFLRHRRFELLTREMPLFACGLEKRTR